MFFKDPTEEDLRCTLSRAPSSFSWLHLRERRANTRAMSYCVASWSASRPGQEKWGTPSSPTYSTTPFLYTTQRRQTGYWLLKEKTLERGFFIF